MTFSGRAMETFASKAPHAELHHDDSDQFDPCTTQAAATAADQADWFRRTSD